MAEVLVVLGWPGIKCLPKTNMLYLIVFNRGEEIFLFVNCNTKLLRSSKCKGIGISSAIHLFILQTTVLRAMSKEGRSDKNRT